MNNKFPEFRRDIEISPLVSENQRYFCLVKIPETGEIYEFGEEEIFLCHQLDGRNSWLEIQESFRTTFGKSLTPRRFQEFLSQLQDSGLTRSDESSASRESACGEEDVFRPLFNPDRFLGALDYLFGFLLSTLFPLALFLALPVAIAVMVRDYAIFFREIELGLNLVTFIPVLGVFFVNPLGELAKGIVCKAIGCEVNTFGVVVLYRILPRFFFDIKESSWRTKKSERLRVVAAGPLFQLLIWSFAVIGWKNTHIGSWMHEFWSALIIASTITLLLNSNPFARRDGYLLLSTWLESANLRTRSLDAFTAWLSGRQTNTGKESIWFVVYGAAITAFECIFWITVLGLIGFVLITVLDGLGAVIFLIVILLRFEKQIKRKMNQMAIFKMCVGNQSGFFQLRYVIQLGFVIAFVAVLLMPYSYSVSNEFRLLPISQYGVRAQVAGEVVEVLVKEGQHVKKGDLIAKLDGREQERRLAESKARYDSVKAQLELLEGGPKAEEVAKAEQQVEAAKTSVEHSRKQMLRQEVLFKNRAVSEKDYDETLKNYDLDKERLKVAEKSLELVRSGAQEEEIRSLEAELRLTEVEVKFNEIDFNLVNICSPAEGKIITMFPELTVGQYLEKGDLFAVIEDSGTLIVEITLAEEDIGLVKVGAEVITKIWADPDNEYITKVSRISPIAYEKSRGRMIRALSEKEWLIEREESINEEGKVVRVQAELANEDGLLKTDMTGYAKITCDTRPVYAAFFQWLKRFVKVEIWSWIP